MFWSVRSSKSHFALGNTEAFLGQRRGVWWTWIVSLIKGYLYTSNIDKERKKMGKKDNIERDN